MKTVEEIYLELEPFEEECVDLMNELKKIRKQRGTFQATKSFELKDSVPTSQQQQTKEDLLSTKNSLEKLQLIEKQQQLVRRENQLMEILKLNKIEIPIKETNNNNNINNNNNNFPINEDKPQISPILRNVTNTPPSTPNNLSPRENNNNNNNNNNQSILPQLTKSSSFNLSQILQEIEGIFQQWIQRVDYTITKIECINLSKQIRDSLNLLNQYKESIPVKPEEYQEYLKKYQKSSKSKIELPNEVNFTMKGEALDLFLKLREKILSSLDGGLDKISYLDFLAKDENSKIYKVQNIEEESLNLLENLKKIVSSSRPGGILISKNRTFKDFSEDYQTNILQLLSSLKQKISNYSIDETTKTAKFIKLLKNEIDKFFSSYGWNNNIVQEPKYNVVPNDKLQSLKNLTISLIQNLEESTKHLCQSLNKCQPYQFSLADSIAHQLEIVQKNLMTKQETK